MGVPAMADGRTGQQKGRLIVSAPRGCKGARCRVAVVGCSRGLFANQCVAIRPGEVHRREERARRGSISGCHSIRDLASRILQSGNRRDRTRDRGAHEALLYESPVPLHKGTTASIRRARESRHRRAQLRALLGLLDHGSETHACSHVGYSLPVPLHRPITPCTIRKGGKVEGNFGSAHKHVRQGFRLARARGVQSGIRE